MKLCTGSVYYSNDRYLLVLSQYEVVMVHSWWHHVSIGQRCLCKLRKDGDLVGWHRCFTHSQTLKDRATQLLRNRSGDLVTQSLDCSNWLSVFNNPIRLNIRPIQILFIGWAKSILTLEAGLGTIHNTLHTVPIQLRAEFFLQFCDTLTWKNWLIFLTIHKKEACPNVQPLLEKALAEKIRLESVI